MADITHSPRERPERMRFDPFMFMVYTLLFLAGIGQLALLVSLDLF